MPYENTIGQIFKHSSEFDQGGGKIRKGAGTFVVALDGSGDFDTIQEAIDALPSTGGEIYIKEGTYYLTNELILRSNVSLTGTGRGTVITSLIDISLVTIDQINTVAQTGINITDILLKGTGAGANPTEALLYIWNSAENVQIKDCSFEDCEWGIHVSATYFNANILIQNCFFDNMVETALAIIIDDSTGVNVDSCFINGNDAVNSVGIGLGTIGGSCDKNILSSNQIQSFADGIKTIHNGISGHCSKNIITNNIIMNTEVNGIIIVDVADTNNIIISNVVNIDNGTAINDAGTNTQVAHNITS